MALTRRVVTRLRFPQLVARARIERDEKAVGRREIDHVAIHAYTAVTWIRLRLRDVLRIRAHVLPDELARDGVEGEHAAATLGDIHEPVRDDRRRDPAAVVAHRVRPHRAQAFHAAAIDLAQRAEGLDVVGAPIAEPIAGRGRAQALGGDRVPRAARRLRLRVSHARAERYQQAQSGPARGTRHGNLARRYRAPMVFWVA